MALEVTMKDQTGKTVFSKQKEYTLADYYFGKKQVPLAEWDITAMEHMDMGIKPGKTDANTFIAHLAEGTKSADVEVNLFYEYSPENRAVVKKVTQKIEFPK